MYTPRIEKLITLKLSGYLLFELELLIDSKSFD